jgi:hypothetical protein
VLNICQVYLRLLYRLPGPELGAAIYLTSIWPGAGDKKLRAAFLGLVRRASQKGAAKNHEAALVTFGKLTSLSAFISTPRMLH